MVAKDDIIARIAVEGVSACCCGDRHGEHSVDLVQFKLFGGIKRGDLVLRKEHQVHIERRVAVDMVVALLAADRIPAAAARQVIVVLAAGDGVVARAAEDHHTCEGVTLVRHPRCVDHIGAGVSKTGTVDRRGWLVVAVAKSIIGRVAIDHQRSISPVVDGDAVGAAAAMDGGDGCVIDGDCAILLIAIAGVGYGQRFVTFAQQDFHDLEAVERYAAAEVDARPSLEVDAHLEAGQGKARIGEEMTERIGGAVGKHTNVGIAVVRVEDVEDVDVARLARRRTVLVAGLVGFRGQQNWRSQDPDLTRTDAALDDQRPANLVEVLIPWRERHDVVVRASEVRIGADLDRRPIVPVAAVEHNGVFEVAADA